MRDRETGRKERREKGRKEEERKKATLILTKKM